MAEVIDVTALNNALKVYGAPKQRKQFNDSTWIHSRMKKMAGKMQLGGRTFEISLKHRGGGSWRTLDEMEQLPNAGSPGYRLATVPTCTAASVFRISLQAWRASKGNERAWVDGKIDAMDDLVTQFALRTGQMYFRAGNGAVARVNGAPTATATGGRFIVDASMSAGSGNTMGLQYLQPEMYISASANTTGKIAEKTMTDARITDLNETLLQVTFDGAGMGSLADNDFIFIGEKQRTSKNRDMNGFLNMIDDGTIAANFLNIDRTAPGNQFWQANRIASVGGADLENVFQIESDTIERRNLGKITDIVTTYGVRRRFANQLKNDRRFVTAAQDGNYKGGFQSAQWMDGNNKAVNIWVDKDCPANTAFLLDWDTIALATLGGDADWLDQGEGILKWVDNTLGYQGIFFLMGNTVCTAPNRNAVLLGITED